MTTTNDMEYELLVMIRARHGKAVTGPLLTPLVAEKSDDLFGIVLKVTFWADEGADLGKLGLDDVIGITNKIHEDLDAGKYKWQVDEGKKK